MSTPSPAPAPARRLPRAALGAVLAAVVVAGGTAVAVASSSSGTAPGATAKAAAPPVAVPQLTVQGATGGVVPWSAPLRLAVTDGTLRSVSVVDPDGADLPGTATTTGWASNSTLYPAATYAVTATVADARGEAHTLPVSVRTTKADHLVTAAVSPGDDAVVGVGRPIAVRLSRDVEDAAARKALVQRLSVRTSPSVEGAWRWMDDRTLHYRAAEFWAPGTEVDVKVDLTRLPLADGAWGSGVRTTHFTVGSAVVSTVDVAAHTMTVRKDGKVLRVMKASMGKPQFATRNGTFIVLEKFADRVMDSATVNLPPGTPAYRTAVKDAVRITNSGTFTHGAPWSVASQGRANVSHGCINLSPSDAHWFYELARRGDVVKVVNSTRGPNSWDAGSMDWNMSFTEWKSQA